MVLTNQGKTMKTITFTDEELTAVTMACYAHRSELRNLIQKSSETFKDERKLFENDLKDLTTATCKLNAMDLI